MHLQSTCHILKDWEKRGSKERLDIFMKMCVFFKNSILGQDNLVSTLKFQNNISFDFNIWDLLFSQKTM